MFKRKYICKVIQGVQVKDIVFESKDSEAIEKAKSFGIFLELKPYKKEEHYYKGIIFHDH
ncbi:hypothetical protein [Enterococcus sp. AZ103]|uniref:hypothetical protein n=1 Tax=Enterococcus sp. AZ103 TaxID=2774628 RepID=UPI003F21988A